VADFMEHVKCIICDIDDTHLVIKKKSFNVVRCKRCDLVYLNPRLEEQELINFYNRQKESIKENIAIMQTESGHHAYNIKKFETAIRLIKSNKKHIKNIFDLGCSSGIFLHTAAQEGWKPHGSDVNRKLIEENKKKYGDQIKLQIGERIDFPDQYFDAVTLLDVIEHLPNPIRTLKEVSRVLKEDGIVVITTPNIDGFFPIITYNLFNKSIGAWDHPTPPGHVFQFSRKTIKKIINKAGLGLNYIYDSAIYPPYTAEKLENSIIDTLKEKKIREIANGNQESSENANKLYESNQVYSKSFLSFKKIPRLIIRFFCYALVEIIYPFAKLIKRGDSMIVIAKKGF